MYVASQFIQITFPGDYKITGLVVGSHTFYSKYRVQLPRMLCVRNSGARQCFGSNLARDRKKLGVYPVLVLNTLARWRRDSVWNGEMWNANFRRELLQKVLKCLLSNTMTYKCRINCALSTFFSMWSSLYKRTKTTIAWKFVFEKKMLIHELGLHYVCNSVPVRGWMEFSINFGLCGLNREFSLKLPH